MPWKCRCVVVGPRPTYFGIIVCNREVGDVKRRELQISISEYSADVWFGFFVHILSCRICFIFPSLVPYH